LPLVSFPYLYQKLGNYNFGLLNFLTAFTQYFILVNDFGFNLSATRDIAVNRSDLAKVNKLFSQVFFAKLFLLFISCSAYLLALPFFPNYNTNKLLFHLGLLLLLGNAYIPTWLFQGLEKLSILTAINITFRTINILLIFLFINNKSDLVYAVIINGVSTILIAIASHFIILKKFRIKIVRCTIFEIFSSLKESSHFFLSRISLTIYTVTNSFLLGLLLGPVAVANYTSAEKIYTALQTVYTPINTALYPYMAQKKNKKLFKKIFKWSIIINILILIIVSVYAPFIFKLLFKQYSIISIYVFYVLLVCCLITVPSIMIGYPYLGALGYGKYVNKTVVLSSVFHICALLMLIVFHLFNEISVSLAVVITESIVLILRLNGIRKINNLHSYSL
jgi:PST family polysaccharide transporter